MNKQQEALKLALGELQAGKVGNAMQILREALAEQPTQQEPLKPKFVRNVDGVPCITLVEHEHLMRFRTSPQPSKPWVALTDEDKAEIEKIVGITEDDDGWMVSRMFTLTEAKLREKNT